MDKAAQFHRRGKQLNVALAPLGGVGKFVGVLQDTFQPTKARILAQYLPFEGIFRVAMFNIKAQGKPYGIDIVTHSLEPLITHSRQVFRIFLPTVRSASAGVFRGQGNHR